MSKIQNTLDCFNNGFNCSQSVLSTYCDSFGLDRETALRLACGLGAGMGRLGETCGAVSAAYLLIGLKHGENKEKTYAMIQNFSRKFTDKNKSTICKKLLGVDLLSDEKSLATGRVQSICPSLVCDAAEIIEELFEIKGLEDLT